ncbi:kremen protein 2 isoform X1 [Tachyglossus aculeatus]|uniref:kremen protein 2 isoform X1 n=1 Tax=Tachyglossus aculeatus TaxID=9261 RepID=UPI0018F4254D|nr:kremen protein 2 isoform X1 [Tachyglossus aculeatus]
MGHLGPGNLLLLLLLPPAQAPWRDPQSHQGPSECYQVNGADYRGSQNRTGPLGAGRPCLFWDQTQQHSYSSSKDPQGRWGLGSHNYCRNPDGDVQPWCYVAETEEGIYWRYCDIPTCHMPGYLGCFVDSGAPPALSGPSGTSTKLTVQVCLRFCRMKGFQLAGVEAGYACFCGSEGDLSRGRPAPATDCDQICFGHRGQLCGGDGRLGIYEVSVGSCQGNWTAPQGVIYSPDFPDEYGPDRNCSWALGPPASALELTFHLFDLADPRDRLELREAGSGRLLGAFDGAQPPPPGPLRFPTAALLLTFRSDPRGHAQGFALTYRGLRDPVEDLGSPQGLIQTPPVPPEGANGSRAPGPQDSSTRMGDRCDSLRPGSSLTFPSPLSWGLLRSDRGGCPTAAPLLLLPATETELLTRPWERAGGGPARAGDGPRGPERLDRVVPWAPSGGRPWPPRRRAARWAPARLPAAQRFEPEFTAIAHLCPLTPPQVLPYRRLFPRYPWGRLLPLKRTSPTPRTDPALSAKPTYL